MQAPQTPQVSAKDDLPFEEMLKALNTTIRNASFHFDRLKDWIEDHEKIIEHLNEENLQFALADFPAPAYYQLRDQFISIENAFLHVENFTLENALIIEKLSNALHTMNWAMSCFSEEHFSIFDEGEKLYRFYELSEEMQEDFIKAGEYAADFCYNNLTKHFPEVATKFDEDKSLFRLVNEDLRLQPAAEPPREEEPRQPLVRWIGTPQEAAFIFDLLIDQGYIEPLTDKTQKASLITQLFNISTAKGTTATIQSMRDYFGRNKMQDPLHEFRVRKSTNYGKGK